jgi:hypothetical protein
VATLCRMPGKAQRGKGGDMLEEAATSRRIPGPGQARRERCERLSGEVEGDARMGFRQQLCATQLTQFVPGLTWSRCKHRSDTRVPLAAP